MSVVWPKKAWSIEEELLKKKTKSSEDKYQSLLTEYHDLRVSNAKTVAKLRELERYKEISDDIVASSSSSRRLDEKERIELSSSLRQYREKLEEAVEQICFLEKENKRLKAELTTTKLDASSSNLLLKNLDDSKFKLSTNESRLQMMRIEILELKNRKADLFSQVQDLKARLTTAETIAEKKSDECKRLTLKLESVETAWDSTRSQNSRIQKKFDRWPKSPTSTELSEKTKVRSLELEKENETLHYKLRTRERTLEELRSDNTDLKSEVAMLKKDIIDLQTLNKDLRRLTSEHNKQEKDCEHTLSMNDTEIKCLREMNASSSKHIEDLVSENARLQHQLLDVHGDYLKKVQSDASWKREEKEKLRREVEEEIDVLKKPRVCKNCHETFTLEKNTAQSCVYHPGRYLPRQYPLEGYSWSCCAKRDISSRPCKFSGRHVEREVL
ncbi:hypothetical protein SPRG_07506 [Saprolegnia parasitica CBS 223.65]|uniref:Uncharacterized protein n=1 Tax=Saprolegnia parasitica (strain CBS 223.65) TaxID=695850 RepID=A0A067CKF1_SAPPC|nr:hypothetical protein SPRG_07506 [Saprolegnia parasitica CBS 223.65]KDO27257.1 hypothetical protein SPRG_07506 [Saprolegnia parasitica CBS 223.65]|eukprot:XP_012202034.1 hypothetical protein SPRG_07506 [Saprolegnia parasitica CBS 223.65]